jgi:23S rRNA pseudouridine2457 synthase
MLSQFSREGEHRALCDLEFDFPKDIYPVGRLDHDSEGLLLLTNDKTINHLLLDPKHAHWRTYLVQVEGSITSEALHLLQNGVEISINGKKHIALKCKAKAIDPPPLPDRNPPIRFRKSVPDSWIELSLTEGKNRQVRRMTAAVGFPTLRLVRFSIEKFSLDTMQPGDVVEIKGSELYATLRLKA